MLIVIKYFLLPNDYDIIFCTFDILFGDNNGKISMMHGLLWLVLHKYIRKYVVGY